MAVTHGDGAEVQQSLSRLAELLTFSEQFSEDPQATLRRYDLDGVPPEAAEAIAGLSPDELRLFARVQHKLGDVPIEDGNCLLF